MSPLPSHPYDDVGFRNFCPAHPRLPVTILIVVVVIQTAKVRSSTR